MWKKRYLSILELLRTVGDLACNPYVEITQIKLPLKSIILLPFIQLYKMSYMLYRTNKEKSHGAFIVFPSLSYSHNSLHNSNKP